MTAAHYGHQQEEAEQEEEEEGKTKVHIHVQPGHGVDWRVHVDKFNPPRKLKVSIPRFLSIVYSIKLVLRNQKYKNLYLNGL